MIQSVPVNDLGRQNRAVMGELSAQLTTVLESGWYILGPQVRQFEAAFADYCGTDHCISTANGTDAIEIALRACGIEPGDRVATVANAGGYSTAAIRAIGAEPLYIDIARDSLLLDVGRLEAQLAAGIRAIIATHLYGRMVDMPRLLAAAGKTGAVVIEDCAQAHGAAQDGKRAGSWGRISCFSFYPTKNLGALGDGGAILTADEQLARRARELRQYGWDGKYRARHPGGRNSRLDEMQAAVLLAKLPHLTAWNERRREIAHTYTKAFRGYNIQAPACSGSNYVAHLYVIRTPQRAKLKSRLQELGIGTDIHYPVPDHQQEAWRDQPWTAGSLPETERACQEVLTLPCFPELTDAEVDHVIDAVRQSLR